MKITKQLHILLFKKICKIYTEDEKKNKISRVRKDNNERILLNDN